MDLLFRITYAAYAKGTHHKLALDAVRHLKCPQAEAWQRVFLKHAKGYVEGSKAPDDSFKDFTNHVLHPRDGLWGGAPDAARTWYHHLIEALETKDWSTAIYCAGVLSHYYTDPLMPFHTGQTEAENNIHRATEWSINRSYDDLRELGEKEWCVKASLLELPDGENWLAEMVVANARMANLSYEKLIAHYDFKRGVVDPPAGLDAVGKRIVAELLRFAALTFADVLARAFAEAKVEPPDVYLTGPMLVAAAGIPANQLMKRIADAQERKLVQAMYDELQATGTVERMLPEDDRIVRNVHAVEVVAKRAALPATSKIFPFKPRQTAKTRKPPAAPVIDNVVALRPALAESAAPARVAPAPVPAVDRVPPPLPAPLAVVPPAVSVPLPAPLAAAPQIPAQAAMEPSPQTKPTVPEPQQEDAPITAPTAAPTTTPATGGTRCFLAVDHDVVDAPSIGPKTADRLYACGVHKVRDLLQADPQSLAAQLDVRHIDAQVIEDWQHQARMVCKVPGLRGTHAQLLVGGGYRTADEVAAADADKLCADVLAFATSAEGQRVLRNGDAPDIEKIKGWLQAARSAIAA